MRTCHRAFSDLEIEPISRGRPGAVEQPVTRAATVKERHDVRCAAFGVKNQDLSSTPNSGQPCLSRLGVSVRSDWTGLVVQLDCAVCPTGRIGPPPVSAKAGGASAAVQRWDILDHAVLEEPSTRTGTNSSTGNCRDPRASILSLQRRGRPWNLGLTGMN